MSINIGNSKIGKIYVGSTAIGKVYKGSELMWKSGPSLKLYGATWSSGSTVWCYVIGSWSTSGLVIRSQSKSWKITSISGVLGSSGSKISASGGGTVTDAIFNKTFTINNIKVYLYFKENGSVDDWLCVMEGSAVGSTVLVNWGSEPLKPTSVTSTTVTDAYVTYTKDSSTDATWYLTGVK